MVVFIARLAGASDSAVPAATPVKVKIIKEIRFLAILLALYLDGDWDKSFLDEQKKSLEAQIRLNEKQRQEIREQLTFLSGEQADLDYIVEYFATLTNFDTEMTQEQQLTLVRAMFTRAGVDREGSTNLTCRIPFPGDGQAPQGPEGLVVNGLDQFQSHLTLEESWTTMVVLRVPAGRGLFSKVPPEKLPLVTNITVPTPAIC